ncbi:LacI family DNA-binding transcriptional regulator [Jiangella anatolica]|uniref:LacI family DNA-binding transcriptional regulator n=1 Tax=Jiangella anatolica TaxID=2670374 RepID=UPI0018F32D74|nr:LacI family DNA-binding transcriptional regulator [Jiangella anatolica]
MATINDVARLAGVSPMTASRVVNGTGNVRPESREKVLRAVEALGYTRNYAASALRRRGTPTWTVGLVLEDVANPYQAQLHRQIEDAVRERGSLVLAASTDEDPRRMSDLILELRSRQVDGLVVAPPPGDQSYLAAGQRQGIPLVLVDRPAVGIAAPAVLSDGRRGTRDAVGHLVAHGHRRIAYITDLRSATMRERHAGFLDGLREHGLAPDDALVRTDVEAPELAAATVRELLALPEPPSALITGRDGTTVGAVRGLHAAGAQHRVAMVGFDDVELADLLEPGLTVVAQDPAAVGRNAAQLLLRQLADPATPVEGVRVPTTLIPRGSGELPAPG